MHLDIYLIMWNFFKFAQKRKKQEGTVPLGQKGHGAAGPEGRKAQASQHAHVRFSNLTGGARASARERGAREW